MRATPSKTFLFTLFLALACVLPLPGNAASYKVLVVMSYHETMPWEREIREGIESELAKNAIIRYVYLNTKNDFNGGKARAVEALEIYRQFQPDGVITADDDAVSLFVIPYLKNKVATPVMFCGVNADPADYGLPASNVSGILERAHFRESIAFLHQLLPSVKKVAFLTIDNPTGKAYVKQVRGEAETYPATIAGIRLAKSLEDALAAAREFRKQSDALFVIAMEGLRDRSGKPLPEKVAYRSISRSFGKPVIGMNDFNVKSGLLCAVAKSGQEQGTTAAKMLTQAMQGVPVSHIPVTQNKQGKRFLNVTVMKSLGIAPRPVFLVGTQLVETEKE